MTETGADSSPSDYELLVDLHRRQSRQAPGGPAETRRALEMCGIDRSAPMAIADLGCGTGASTLILAEDLAGTILALDRAPEFIAELNRRSENAGLGERIHPMMGCLESLPFAEASLDMIWSEGAIYTIGFRRGLMQWRRALKAGGTIALSELVWTTETRPRELQVYWDAEYPEIESMAGKLEVVDQCGYASIGSFVLPVECWRENYYVPLQASLDAFVARHPDCPRARELAEAEQREIGFFRRHGEHFGYAFIVARRR